MVIGHRPPSVLRVVRCASADPRVSAPGRRAFYAHLLSNTTLTRPPCARKAKTPLQHKHPQNAHYADTQTFYNPTIRNMLQPTLWIHLCITCGYCVYNSGTTLHQGGYYATPTGVPDPKRGVLRYTKGGTTLHQGPCFLQGLCLTPHWVKSLLHVLHQIISKYFLQIRARFSGDRPARAPFTYRSVRHHS